MIELLKLQNKLRMMDIREIVENAENPNLGFFPNFGKRNLYETIKHNYNENSSELIRVLDDFKELSKSFKNKPILIGGLAVDYWCRGRPTEDVDVFFLTLQRLPSKIWYGSTKFKPTFSSNDKHAERLYHRGTGREVDLVTPSEINLPSRYAAYIYTTAKLDNGFKIASVEGLILMKLSSGRQKDLVDITMLLEVPNTDLGKIDKILTQQHKTVLSNLKPHNNRYESKAIEIINKAKKLQEDFKLSVVNGKPFIAKIGKLADKLGLEWTYDQSRQSYSIYFDFTNNDWDDLFRIRISDHYSGGSNMTGVDKNYYNSEFSSVNELLVDIEKVLKANFK